MSQHVYSWFVMTHHLVQYNGFVKPQHAYQCCVSVVYSGHHRDSVDSPPIFPWRHCDDERAAPVSTLGCCSTCQADSDAWSRSRWAWWSGLCGHAICMIDVAIVIIIIVIETIWCCLHYHCGLWIHTSLVIVHWLALTIDTKKWTLWLTVTASNTAGQLVHRWI